MSRLAILAFSGRLPQALAAAHPGALYLTFGAESAAPSPGTEQAEASYERWGAMFQTLRDHGVTDLVLAGGLQRPALNPANFDTETMALVPRLMQALGQGDDGLLRTVIAIFEEAGFAVKGAHTLLPDLTATPGVLTKAEPSDVDAADADKALAILAALGAQDVGQGAVVRGKLCLGIETVQGTDAMLDFVARTAPEGTGGVLVKAPKPGQDLRVDMPAIGPRTIAGAKAAGLSGIVIAAGAVVLLDRAETLAAADEAGLFVEARAL